MEWRVQVVISAAGPLFAWHWPIEVSERLMVLYKLQTWDHTKLHAGVHKFKMANSIVSPLLDAHVSHTASLQHIEDALGRVNQLAPIGSIAQNVTLHRADRPTESSGAVACARRSATAPGHHPA